MTLDPQALAGFMKESGLAYKSAGRSFVLNCPKCSKSKKLYIRKRDGAFKCFSCADINGFKGRAEYALHVLTNQPVDEIRRTLYGEVSIKDFDKTFTFDVLDFDPIVEEDIFLPEPRTYPYGYFPIDHKLSVPGLKYLEGRGIPLDIAKQYDIYYDINSQRVIFPVKATGDLYGWQGRYIKDTTVVLPNKIVEIPKAKTEYNTPRDKLVMFYDRLIGSDQAILTEGALDCLKTHACGLGNVCAMGKEVTPLQIQLIRHLGIKKIYLGLDPDAIQNTMKLIGSISDEFEIYLLEPLPGYKDLGEMSFEQVYQQYLKAKPLSQDRSDLITRLCFNF